ncbi:MAG: hypothetical protein ABIU86_07725 [Gemmatimonadaceae bacterium]
MNRRWVITLTLALVTLVVYFVSCRGEGAGFDYLVRQAYAFAHGRLDVDEQPLHLQELLPWHGKWYVVFPPVPSLILVPFVAIFGRGFFQPLLSIVLGAVNVGLAHRLFLRLFARPATDIPDTGAATNDSGTSVANWLALLYAFGTIQWYHAEVGSAWYATQIVALTFMWLFLLEATGRGRPVVCGLLVGAAHLSRLPCLFAAVFLPLYQRDVFFDGRRPRLRPFILLALGVLPALVLNAFFNYARFGTLKDVQFIHLQLLPAIGQEHNYRFGLMSVRYIPEHLKEILTAMPLWRSSFPYVIPSEFAMAIWFTTPAFVLMLRARRREKLWLPSVAAALAVALPSLMHGGNGFTQFGYRHTLDYMPFLLLLVGLGMRGKVDPWTRGLIVASMLVNLWGVLMISRFGIFGF